MNGQMQRPQSWEEWADHLKKTIDSVEIDLCLLKAQLEEAEKHINKK